MGKSRRTPRADGALTRTRILEAAGQLFAAAGYAETTSKAIAAEACVDLASVNYHFGSRSGLYQAVLAEAHRRFVSLSDLSALADSDLSPSDKLGRLIEGLVERSVTIEGWHARVLARELLSPSSHLQALIADEVLPKLSVLKRILSDITAIPVNDPALLRCIVSVGAPCLMLLVVGHNVPGPLQDVLHMPGPVLVRHLHEFAMAGLAAISHQYHAG